MRKKNHKQIPFMSPDVDHQKAVELGGISKILDENPIISEMVLQELTRHVTHSDAGAEGMSAEQVVRAAIIKQTEGLSYEELCFHLMDSRTYRRFCKIGFAHKGFQKSTLHHNIKAISPQSWEEINRILVSYGQREKIEKGRQSRMDCTVVSSNIHEPTDSSLLWDCVRVLTRMRCQANERFGGLGFPFSDHTRRAKRRMLGIMNAKKQTQRNRGYKDLLKITHKVVNDSKTVVGLLERSHDNVEAPHCTAAQFKKVIELTNKVIDQTTRRVIHGESVPSSEKIVSIFEPHTDIIKKDRRDTLYGHKVCLSSGPSNLITDCLIVDGNPADTTLTDIMLDRHKDLYGRYPLKVAFDGGFASKNNLASAKAKRIKDVCFAKKRGIKVEDMCRSFYVYRRLRRFRAGIESGISWLKRCFGLDRCTWKSLPSFRSYIWASIVAANLLTLVRKQIA